MYKKRRMLNPITAKKDVETRKKYVRRVYSENPSRKLEHNRNWKAANPEKIRVINLNRIARQREAEGVFTKADIDLILEEQGRVCPGCLSRFTSDLIPTIDHFIPLNKGGSNWPENIQLLCKSCNCSKRDSLWEEWNNG